MPGIKDALPAEAMPKKVQFAGNTGVPSLIIV
jgi:hypothetical protein